MLTYASLFIGQVLFLFGRTLSIKYTADGHMIPTIFWNVILAFMWIVTSALGVTAVVEYDYIGVLAYLAGAGVGSYLALKYIIKRP